MEKNCKDCGWRERVLVGKPNVKPEDEDYCVALPQIITVTGRTTPCSLFTLDTEAGK
jgi:hypothetical protein